MNFLTVAEACLILVNPRLLPGALALLSACGSSTQPEPASAGDIARYADSMGRDYAIHSPAFVRGNEYESGQVTLDVDHGEIHPYALNTRDMYTISAEVPPGVNITSAALAYEGDDYSGHSDRRIDECVVGHRVTCRYKGEPVENVSLKIDYNVFAPGDHEFTASIVSDDRDPDLANNVRTIIFRYVASTRYLQSLLDSTEANGSVTLPSGTYMGTLHGGDRLLNVHGAEDGGTVLLTDDQEIPLLEHIGDGSTFGNLEFRSSGAPILIRSGYNITIRDSLIAPIEGAWHNMQKLFVNNSYRLLYNRIEGWGGEHGHCRSLLYVGPHYSDTGSLMGGSADSASIHQSEWIFGTEAYRSNSTPSSIYIQNTIFRGNECTNLLMEYSAKSFRIINETPVEDSNPRLFILNNTFVNNKGRIHFSMNRDTDVQIKNNIFLAHQDPVTLPPANYQRGDYRFILARNLVWDSNFESLVDPDIAAGPGVSIEASDINTDPHFADSDGGNYSLATGSPAIDAGVPVDAYYWTDRKGGVSSVQPVPGQEPTPVDGLLDGYESMDIGAFEYIP